MTCNVRCTLVVFSIIQIIAITEKQVFDLLCFLWTPILLNCLHLIMTVIVLVGICRYIYRILVIYSVWCLVWTTWNIFVVCFYYEVGLLRMDLPVMNLGCTRFAWLPSGFLGCSNNFMDNSTSDPNNFTLDPMLFSGDTEATNMYLSTPLLSEPETDIAEKDLLLTEPWLSEGQTIYTQDEEGYTTVSKLLEKPAKVDPFQGNALVNDSYPVDALFLGSPEPLGGERESVALVSLSYGTLQVAHAALQCFLAVCCFILTCTLAHIYSEEEDSSCLEFDFISGSLLPQNEKSPAQRYHLKALYVSTGSPR